MSSIIKHFVHGEHQIRIKGTEEIPIFCAKDVCTALGIVNHRDKVAKLDEDEKRVSVEPTASGRQRMLFVTEPGLYKIILSCREASIPGTAPHAFCRWVTHEVLPSIRRTQRYELRMQIEGEFSAEKGRRLWNFVKEMDVWSFNARRKFFGRICGETKHLCTVDRFNAPHVNPDRLVDAKAQIRQTMSAAVLDAVPEDQSLITQYFQSPIFE